MSCRHPDFSVSPLPSMMTSFPRRCSDPGNGLPGAVQPWTEPICGPRSAGLQNPIMSTLVVYNDLENLPHTSPLPKGHTRGVYPSSPYYISTNSNGQKVSKSGSVRDLGQSQASQPCHYCHLGWDHSLLFGAILGLVGCLRHLWLLASILSSPPSAATTKNVSRCPLRGTS